MTAEMELVLLLSRVTFSEKNIEDIYAISKKDIKWNEVVKYSLMNKVVSLIYYNLKNNFPDIAIPNYIRYIFIAINQGIEKRNRYLALERKVIENALEMNKIDFILVKGNYMLDNVYKKLQEVRFSGDFDYLVHKYDEKSIQKAMNEIGYIQGKYDFYKKEIIAMKRNEEIKYKIGMSNMYPFCKKMNLDDILPCSYIDFRFSLDDTLDFEFTDEVIDNIKNGKEEEVYRFIHLCTHFYNEGKHVSSIEQKEDMTLMKMCDIREYILKYIKKEQWEIIQKIVYSGKNHEIQKAILYTLYFLEKTYMEKYTDLLEIQEQDYFFSYGRTTLTTEYQIEKNIWKRIFGSDK